MRQRNRGFTLIEILVVLVIIGLMAGAMVMIGSDNRAAIARDEIEKLNAKLKLALEEAQLHGVEFGLVVTETDYRFVTFGADRWTPISDDKAYQTYRLPDGFELALEIEGFKLAGARLPGARITDDGKVVTDGADERDERAGKKSAREDDRAEGSSKDGSAAEGSESDNAERAERGEGNAESDEAEPESLLPQIFLLSSGELNPFVLAIGNRDDNPVFYRLRSNIWGDIKLEGPIQGDLVSDLTLPWDNPDPNAVPEEDAEDGTGESNSLMNRERPARERSGTAREAGNDRK